MVKRDITGSQIEAHFRIDPELGTIEYQTRGGNWWHAGYIKPGGHDSGGGYRIISVPVAPWRYLRIRAHHLVWMWVHGQWPTTEIDHRNGDRDDNRIANLRAAQVSQNRSNKVRSRNNKSGYKWVSKQHGKLGVWRSEVNYRHDGKPTRRITYHSNPETAFEDASAFAKIVHGEFFNSG